MVPATQDSPVRTGFALEEVMSSDPISKVIKWQYRVYGAGQFTKTYCLISACAIVVAIGILLSIDINRYSSFESQMHEFLFTVDINLKLHAVESYFLMFLSVLFVRAAIYYLAGSLMSKAKLKSSILIEWWVSLVVFFMALESVMLMLVHDFIPEAQALLIAFFVSDLTVQVCLLFVGWGFALSCRKYHKSTVPDSHITELPSDEISNV